MPKKITVELDDPIAEMLSQAVQEINEACKAEWTPATLAASFLEHVLCDEVCNCGDQTVH